MVVDRVLEILSFKQSKWLEKYKNFVTQKRSQAINDFVKAFYNLLKNTSYGIKRKNSVTVES